MRDSLAPFWVLPQAAPGVGVGVGLGVGVGFGLGAAESPAGGESESPAALPLGSSPSDGEPASISPDPHAACVASAATSDRRMIRSPDISMGASDGLFSNPRAGPMIWIIGLFFPRSGSRPDKL